MQSVRNVLYNLHQVISEGLIFFVNSESQLNTSGYRNINENKVKIATSND